MIAWDSISNGQRTELGLVSVDIAGHSNLPGADRILKRAKDIFRDQMEGIASAHGGKLFNWAGDGGAFMFLTGSGEGFDDFVFSAIQMLNSMPGINEEIQIRAGLEVCLDVRISCHEGVATFDADPSKITADFVNSFLKNERKIGIQNSVCITAQVWKQLTPQLQHRFHHLKQSPELACEIYNYLEVLRGVVGTPKVSSTSGQGRQKAGSVSKVDSQSQRETKEETQRLQEELDRKTEELTRTKEKLSQTLGLLRKSLRLIDK